MNKVSITTLIREQFPEFYETEGEMLELFVSAYYEWLEQTPWGDASILLQYNDIDTTVDDFLIYFKNMYVKNLPLNTVSNVKNFIKHANDFYNVRGTPQSVKLLFALLYGVDSNVYVPNQDILRASDGTWTQPIYLEVTVSPLTTGFIAQQITGVLSGATAFAESVARKFSKGRYFDVIYLSQVVGNFQYGEIITADGSIENCPVVIGSLTNINIISGGKDNIVGDVLNINSNTGTQGLARISNTVNGTGRVSFTIDSGGTGYTINPETYTSANVIAISNTTGIFTIGETAYQRVEQVQFVQATGNFILRDIVTGYTANTQVNQGSGIIAAVTQTGANGVLTIVCSNSFTEYAFADIISNQSNVSALVQSVTDISANGIIVGYNSNNIGLYGIDNHFYVGNNFFLTGQYSNAVTYLNSYYTGTSAFFSIGALTNTEIISVNTDQFISINAANVEFINTMLTGEGSGFGSVSNVSILTGGSGYSNGVYSFVGGGPVVNTVVIVTGGSGYANGERLVFTGNTNHAATGIVTTNANGTIVSITMGVKGIYNITPTVTVNTAAGSGASLTPSMPNSFSANLTLTTNANGSITTAAVGNTGSNYYNAPTLPLPSGSNVATYTVNMNYGLGFHRLPSGNINTSFNDLLTYENLTIGTISALTGVSPGQQYNQNPFVYVEEPFVASFDLHDLVIAISNTVGLFIQGETLEQNYYANLVQLSITSETGSFANNETIVQAGANAMYVSGNSSVILVQPISGTFNANTITGIVSGTTAQVISSNNIQQLSTSKGIIKTANSTILTVARSSFFEAFNTVGSIFGLRSGATANINYVINDYTSLNMGNNAVITANVQTANGIAVSVNIIDSGFGFQQGELVTLSSNTTQYVIDGIVELNNQGIGEGYWTSTKGFISADKYIEDNNYYQPFTYEIQTNMSLNGYSDIVKKLIHVSGTVLFGRTILSTEVENNFTTKESSIVQNNGS